MWTLKMEVAPRNTVMGALAKRYNIAFVGYPLAYTKTRKGLLVQLCGYVGDVTARERKILEQIREEKLFQRLYEYEGFVIATVLFPSWLDVLYAPEIIFVKPMYYDRKGTEHVEVASWTKDPLMRLVKTMQQKYAAKIVSFHQEEISSISFFGVRPLLTAKQKKALSLAVRHGYYAFPKRITLKQLAKKMGVSFSTYQAHLAKAESRFLPAVLDTFS